MSDFAIERERYAEFAAALVQRALDDLALTARRPDDGIYTTDDLHRYQQDARWFLDEVKGRAEAFNDGIAAVFWTVLERRDKSPGQLALLAARNDEDMDAPKRCTRCGETKTIDHFAWVTTRGYYDSWCRDCRREVNRVTRPLRRAKQKARKVAHA